MVEAQQYKPDYLTAPGEILSEYLDSYGMSQAELADRLGASKKTVNEIIKAKAPITTEMALKLEKVFERPAHFWRNLESRYSEAFARAEEAERLKDNLDWLKQIPIKKMVEFGWIKKFTKKSEQLTEVLRFYGVASRQQWQEVWETHQVAYRQSQTHKAHAEAVSAWLRQGEIEAQRNACGNFNRIGFLEILNKARGWTTESPQVFAPKIIEQCATVGVSVVFLPELPRMGISGATRWIGGNPIMQLSLRYKRDDQLWFTFFHEAGHILKHGKKEVFLESNKLDDEKEREANNFAANHLIPRVEWAKFTEKRDFFDQSIVEFSDQLGIAPGIVVGRLQREKFLKFSQGTRFFVRLKWAEAS